MRLRHFILSLTLFVAMAASMAASAAAPKYVFYFIGDGMGHGAVMLAQLYNRTVLGNDLPLTMLQLPVASMAITHSASSPVTDSAAAGTALACGHKTNNGMLGVTPDSAVVTSIAKILYDDGYGIGLVTTVAPDDATPGAFYAHVPARSMYFEIGKQAAASGYDFIAGAGLRGGRKDAAKKAELLEAFEQNGVDVVRGTEGLATVKRSRVLLLNTDTVSLNDIGYSVDSIEGILSLPVMTQACLDHLLKNKPDKFFMMVEGGSIDHAGHSNDPGASIGETLAFDRSLAIAYDFYRQHPDETLIVVTADHETGGLVLGNNELHYTMNPQVLKYSRMSIGKFSDLCKSMVNDRRNYIWDDMRDILRDNFGLFGPVKVSEKDEANLREQFEAAMEQRNSEDRKTLYASFSSFVGDVFKLVSRLSGVGWTTYDHSGNPVPVYAAGVGAEKFSGAQDNTEIPKKILEITGHSF